MPGAAVAAGLVGRRVSNLESRVEGAGWGAGPNGRCTWKAAR